jgi:hypothetical protein
VNSNSGCLPLIMVAAFFAIGARFISSIVMPLSLKV